MSIKILFCWSDISGYMTACWRALRDLPEIDLFVIAFQAHMESAFADQLMQGIPHKLLDSQERHDSRLIERLVFAQQPDVVVLAGWFHKPYRELPFVAALSDMIFIMGMDTPWSGTWKQQIAPWFLRSFLKHMDYIVVTGERSWQYARHLGIPPANIMCGLYGIDYATWSHLGEQRQQTSWPRSFLFVGRYTEAKAVDILAKAYSQYRTLVGDPWPLVCCGQGPLASVLEAQVGIDNRGFIQPHAMQSVWQEAGVFLLPSRFDPWPLALVEAAAAGLPILCTDACGSAVEVVRSGYNGIMIPPNDSVALADALVRIHQKYNELPVWGAHSQQLAAPYAADLWAERWRTLIMDVTAIKHTQGMESAT